MTDKRVDLARHRRHVTHFVALTPAVVKILDVNPQRVAFFLPANNANLIWWGDKNITTSSGCFNIPPNTMAPVWRVEDLGDGIWGEIYACATGNTGLFAFVEVLATDPYPYTE